ncbi:hypothetical protein EON63_05805 [archaeon]|nr:MAG: hypothetical protein EON63_05805 [archaeon]
MKKISKDEQVDPTHIVSPSPSFQENSTVTSSPARKLAFGRSSDVLNPTNRLVVPDSAKIVYKVLNKATGSLGGNGYNGAIYGELTIGSMQKVINILKEKCRLTSKSRFIDVGAGN